MDIKLTKKAFIEAYSKSFGNISQSCKAVGISRQTYYNWINDDPNFKIELDAVDPKELRLDFLESKLIERINKGDTTATIFGLKTLGKSRGYVERQEITGGDGAKLFEIVIVKNEDKD